MLEFVPPGAADAPRLSSRGPMDQRIREISAYAHELSFGDLPAAVVHECKRKLIDTLGCAIGGFHSEPASIARTMASHSRGNPAARVLGTQLSLIHI